MITASLRHPLYISSLISIQWEQHHAKCIVKLMLDKMLTLDYARIMMHLIIENFSHLECKHHNDDQKARPRVCSYASSNIHCRFELNANCSRLTCSLIMHACWCLTVIMHTVTFTVHLETMHGSYTQSNTMASPCLGRHSEHEHITVLSTVNCYARAVLAQNKPRGSVPSSSMTSFHCLCTTDLFTCLLAALWPNGWDVMKKKGRELRAQLNQLWDEKSY